MRKIFIGIAILVSGGLVLGLLLPMGAYLLSTKEDTRFRVPGTFHTGPLESGKYNIWHHNMTLFEGEYFNQPVGIPDGTEISVKRSNGGLVEIKSISSSPSEAGGESRYVIGVFELLTPDRLSIVAAGPPPDSVFSVTRATGGHLTVHLVSTFAIGNLLVLIGLAIAGWGFLTMVGKRRKSGSSDLLL